MSWIERRTNDSILSLGKETKKILSTIKNRRWIMIRHVLRHEEDFLHIKIEGR